MIRIEARRAMPRATWMKPRFSAPAMIRRWNRPLEVRMFFYYQTITKMVLLAIAGIVFAGWLLNSGPTPLWFQTVMVLIVLGGSGFAVWFVTVILAQARTVGEVDSTVIIRW